MELKSYLEDVFCEPILIEELPYTNHIPFYLLRLFKLRLCRMQNIEIDPRIQIAFEELMQEVE